MGDAGSIPLGFLLGLLLLDLALRGQWAAALILPAYFLADATLTLLWRLLTGHRPWQAHKTHFYQRAVTGGANHADVVMRVSVANILLIVLALASIRHPEPSLGLAAGVVVFLLAVLLLHARGRGKAAARLSTQAHTGASEP
jgi:UDP-N-acetylmuramyl pentapeptide phosphotransferase/UDP-N-acetylglucosamine-1-phosphate transferase